MWDLEYLLLFGVPNNKWEILDGRVRWAFPFLARDVAQAHFEAWTDTLLRWRNGGEPRVHETPTADGSQRSILRFDGVEMSLYPRPIELRMPMDFDVFDACTTPSGGGICGRARSPRTRPGGKVLSVTPTCSSTSGSSSANSAECPQASTVAGWRSC